MFDERTQHHNLQLPHASNQLDEDVERLRAALVQIDNLLNWTTTKLASDDQTLDSLQEVVARLKYATGALSLIEPAITSVFTYDSDGRVSSVADVLESGQSRMTTYTYNPDGTIETKVIEIDGTTWTTTYTYSSGRVSSFARVAG